MLFLMAVLPSIVFLFIVWKLDRIEKEPIGLMLGLFFLGVLSVPFIAIMEGVMSELNFFPEGGFLYNLVDAFWIVGPCEEIGKFLVLFLLTWWNKNFDHKYDAIVYSSAVTLGFATLENVLYVFDSELGGLDTAIGRMLLSIPGHLTFGLFMGLFYGFMKKYANDKKWFQCVLFGCLTIYVPIILHGVYDFLLFLDNSIALILFLLFVLTVDFASIIVLIISILTDKKIIYGEQLRESFRVSENIDDASMDNEMIVEEINSP